VEVLCWLVVHTSDGPRDNRSYDQYQGLVVRELAGKRGDMLLVNFYETFSKHRINMKYNDYQQTILDSECMYETP